MPSSIKSEKNNYKKQASRMQSSMPDFYWNLYVIRIEMPYMRMEIRK